jgi:GNAT superfamily N-acetyltransferase
MTTATTQTTIMRDDQIAESGAVLARAFHDDPMMMWIEPDDARRGRSMNWFMSKGAIYGHRYGEVHTTPGKVDGNAVWLPPGDTKVGTMRMMRTGMIAAPIKLGFSQFNRFMKVMNIFEHLHEQAMPDRHWYLMILGVDPPRQGQGVGGALIAPVLARADAESLPCYLETAKARNVTFYQKHGFEVVVEDDVPDGFHYWTMKRPARA